MSEPIVKTFISDVKSVNEQDFTLEAVISDETVDRYGEVIKVDAWKKRLYRYKQNPILLTSHRYDKLTNQIGEATKVGVVDGKLVAKFKYYVNEGNPEADWGWKLASKFGRAAYSVGFLPYEYEDKEYDEDVKKGKKPYREYIDVELLEVSQVLVPANPSAMMKSFNEEEDTELKGYIDFVRKGLETDTDYETIIKEDLVGKDAEDIIETKPDTENYVHIEVDGEKDKHKNHDIKTITISASKGIKAHYCTESDCKKIIGYLFDKEKGWTHETAQEWVDEHSKMMVGDRCEVCYTADAGELFLTYWLTYDELTNITDMNKSPEIEEECMEEILNAVKTLEEKIDAIKAWIDAKAEEEELFNKQLEEDFKELETLKSKAVEETTSYIKQLLEDTNSVLEQTISVQSK